MGPSGNLHAAAAAFSQGGRLATFYVDRLLFGVDISDAQEVLPPQAMTRVPLAPRALSGLINLRGRIVTTIDLREQLALRPRARDTAPMNFVVRSGDESLSLLVDQIGDIIDVDANAFERPPINIDSAVKELISGVYKLNGQLILVLDIHAVAAAMDLTSRDGFPEGAEEE